MRKRFAVTLAAGGRWPDNLTGGIGFRFNWLKVQNTGGANPVTVGLNAGVQAGDPIDALIPNVNKNEVHVLNLAGPKQADGTNMEDWPDQVYLVSASGTTVLIEVADHPIVHMVYTV